MLQIHQFALNLHIVIGCVALVVFWLPLFAKKGSANHVMFGKIYSNSMYIVSISGIMLTSIALLDPLGIRAPGQVLSPEKAARIIEYNRNMALFLMMLSVLILTSVRHSLIVLKARDDRSQLHQWHHLGLVGFLTLLAIVVSAIGWIEGHWLLRIFGGVGLVSAYNIWKYLFKAQLSKREWIIEHLNNILGSGIGVYTAFFAVGGRHLMAEVLPGNWQLVAWVAPALIGSILSAKAVKKYQQKYRVA